LTWRFQDGHRPRGILKMTKKTMDDVIFVDDTRGYPWWYVTGFRQHRFSTKEDAEAALALARQFARNERNEIAEKVENTINTIKTNLLT
jgi:hypothetical protein